MPLHDVGYRAWNGSKTSPLWRWWTIATVGVRLAFRSTWLSRTLVLSWVPAIVVGIGFFAYEQSIVRPELRELGAQFMRIAGASPQMMEAAQGDPATARHDVWSALLLAFFRYPQSIVMLILVGIVAPRLISYDLRNRGYLLYFSRPIRPVEYLLGKSLIVWTFLALITTLPALLLYGVGIGLSTEVSVFWFTWDLPLRILLASLALMIPTTAMALACSAMTIESRYAAFTWFALWIVGWVSYSVLSVGELAGKQQSLAVQNEFPQALAFISKWELLSPYHVLGRVQQWIFGLYPTDQSIAPYLMVLSSVTCIALWFIHRQLRLRLSQ